MEKRTKLVILMSLLGLGLVSLALFAPEIHVWSQKQKYSERRGMV